MATSRQETTDPRFAIQPILEVLRGTADLHKMMDLHEAKLAADNAIRAEYVIAATIWRERLEERLAALEDRLAELEGDAS
jgi:lysine/ornithine N-monooxygenase